MGTRLELYVDAEAAASIIEISAIFNIRAQVIGRVEGSKDNSMSVTVITNTETLVYQEK